AGEPQRDGAREVPRSDDRHGRVEMAAPPRRAHRQRGGDAAQQAQKQRRAIVKHRLVPITAETIIAPIIETRPLNSTVSIIAWNGRGISSGWPGRVCATAAAPSSVAANSRATIATWRCSRYVSRR